MGEFENPLCGCFKDCKICILTFFCSCYTAGKNAETVGDSCCCFGCLSTLGPVGIWSRAKVRGKIRESKNIDGSFMMDCLMHWICAICALVQEANEMGSLGMAIERE